MAVKTGRDGVLCCGKNMFQDVWGVKEGREDGTVPYGLGVGLCLVFALRLFGANLDRFGEGK